MGRLTRRIIKKFPNHTTEAIELNSEWGKMDIHANEEFYDIAEKLAHYEDMEEQGRLIEQTHGKWIRTGAISYRCSECNFLPLQDDTAFCPNCGAKMVATKEEAEAKLKELEGDKDELENK